MNPDYFEAQNATPPAPPAAPSFEQIFPAEHSRLRAAEDHLKALEPRLAQLEADAAQWVEMITKAAESPAMAGVLRMLGIKLP